MKNGLVTIAACTAFVVLATVAGAGVSIINPGNNISGLATSTTFGGDVSGTYDDISVVTVAAMAAADLTNGATQGSAAYAWGDHGEMDYLTNGVAATLGNFCTNTPSAGQVAKYDAVGDRWYAADDNEGEGGSYLTSSSDFGGDVSGTYDAIAITQFSGLASATLTNYAVKGNAAYGWGDHADGGYLTEYTETDPTAVATNTGHSGDVSGFYNAIVVTQVNGVAVADLTSQAANGETAHGWGDHSGEGYLTDETDPSAVKTNTAHGGDVSGFYSAIVVTQVNGVAAASLTSQAANGETAHGWGDHADGGYLDGSSTFSGDVSGNYDSIAVTNVSGTAKINEVAASALTSQAANGETAHGWGDHGGEGYLTSESQNLADVITAGNGNGGGGTITNVYLSAFATNTASDNQVAKYDTDSKRWYMADDETLGGTEIVITDTFGGDVSGTYDAILVTNMSGMSAASITNGVTKGLAAHGWGNHADGGYLSNGDSATFVQATATGTVDAAAQTRDRVSVGVNAGLPRIVMEDSGVNLWQILNENGALTGYIGTTKQLAWPSSGGFTIYSGGNAKILFRISGDSDFGGLAMTNIILGAFTTNTPSAGQVPKYDATGNRWYAADDNAGAGGGGVTNAGYTLAVPTGDWEGDMAAGSGSANAVVWVGYSTANTTNNQNSGDAWYSAETTLQERYYYRLAGAPSTASKIGAGGIVLQVRASSTNAAVCKIDALVGDTQVTVSTNALRATVANEWKSYTVTPHVNWTNALPDFAVDGVTVQALDVRLDVYCSNSNSIQCRMLVDWD